MDAGLYWVKARDDDTSWDVARREENGKWNTIGSDIPLENDAEMEMFYEIGVKLEQKTL